MGLVIRMRQLLIMNYELRIANGIVRNCILLVVLVMFFLAGTISAGELPGSGEDAVKGVVSGKVMMKGGDPMVGGIVTFYNVLTGPSPQNDKYWRVPDELADIASIGSFSVELAAGSYYMEAMKRVSGKNVGPPGPGDYFYNGRDEDGNHKVYTIKSGQTIDIGTISEVPKYEEVIAKDITGVQGTIIDKDGEPVEGAIVFAYETNKLTASPLFVSGRTADNGRYLMRVSKEGKYYLRVRDVYGGGPPHGGALISGYTATAVTIKAGAVQEGVDIQVKLPSGREAD